MVANEFTQAVIDLVESAQQRADAEEAQTLDRQLEVVEGVLEDRSTEVLADEFQRRVTEAREAEPANSSEALASLLGELPEESQEVILEPLNPDDVEEPADVREALQQAEGGAVGQAAAVLAGTIALETASAGQVESQQFLVSQVLTFLLNAVEFEELVETPAELGLVVDDEVLQDELDRAGYAEDTKDFFSRTNDAIRRSARVYQELLVSEDLVSTLDTLVEDGVIDPEEAVARIPDEVDAEDSAFRQRFELLAEQEAGTPSRSQFETSFANGFSTLETLRERLDETAYPTEQFEDVVDATLLDELDGDLQRAVGLGLIDETTYANLAEDLGLDDETVDRLLRGEDLGDIAERRLTEQTPPEERSVETIVGIGQSRAAALRAAGVETVDDLARERPEELASVVDVTPEAAQEFVARAARRVQGR